MGSFLSLQTTVEITNISSRSATRCTNAISSSHNRSVDRVRVRVMVMVRTNDISSSHKWSVSCHADKGASAACVFLCLYWYRGYIRCRPLQQYIGIIWVDAVYDLYGSMQSMTYAVYDLLSMQSMTYMGRCSL